MLRLIKNTTFRMLMVVILIITIILCFAFKEQLLVQRDHVVAYYKVYEGDKYYKKKKLQKAIDYYNEALELYPEHVKARYNLGNIYVTYEDFDSAVFCYEKVLEYKPDFLRARLNLAIILAEEFHYYERALSEYKKVIDYSPFIIKVPIIYNNEHYVNVNKATAWYNMGLAYKGQSLLYGYKPNISRVYLEKAADSYKKALKIDPDNYDTNYNLGLTLHLLGLQTEATEAYCKAINISPLNYEAHYNLAILFRDSRNFVESVVELEKAGIILDAKGDVYISSYIYDVLNEVTSYARSQPNYKMLIEKINNAPVNNVQLRYINGKVVASEAFDMAIIENMRHCNTCQDIIEDKK